MVTGKSMPAVFENQPPSHGYTKLRRHSRAPHPCDVCASWAPVLDLRRGSSRRQGSRTAGLASRVVSCVILWYLSEARSSA